MIRGPHQLFLVDTAPVGISTSCSGEDSPDQENRISDGGADGALKPQHCGGVGPHLAARHG